jgi:hypothetical protein
LVLVQQQHCAQVSQALVGESRGGEELQTFDLSKVGSLPERKEIKELRNIVSPVCAGQSKYAQAQVAAAYRILESWLSSLKLERMAALSF